MTDIRIPNIQNYTWRIENDVLILTPKENITQQNDITDFKLNETDLHSSKIIHCAVKKRDEIISGKRKYMSILKDIWKSMPTTKIMQNTTFNMKPVKDETCGYKWYPELGLSIQNKDANGTMKEILNMVKLCNYFIDLSIKLKNGEMIRYKYNV